MQRFISHHELARDKRFIRAKNTTVGAEGLPDDVDTLVAIFEKMAPEIERRIRGTKLEQIYAEVGPGFQILSQLGRLGADAKSSMIQMASRMHGILVGEMQALEAAGRTTWDFPELEWGFKMNMARQCWDEARHVQIYEKLLGHVGAYVGMFPEATFLFECACSDDPAMRVAGVNRGLEGLACDVFRDMIRYAEKLGDDLMRQAIDFVLADELTHVRFGSEWVREFTKGNPEHHQKVKEFQAESDTESVLRVSVVPGGCSGFEYGLDMDTEIREDDFSFDSEGVNVVIDPFSAQYLAGVIVGYHSSFQDTGFTFENPNATGSCGCGTSFAV